MNLDRAATQTYSSGIMATGKDINATGMFRRVTRRGRKRAAIILALLLAFFGCAAVVAAGWVDFGKIAGPCGFQQRYQLPCMSCGMTHSVVAFMRGRLFESFYHQPAAALICCIMVIAVFLSSITVVSGLYLRFLDRLFRDISAGYWILAIIIVLLGGWAVTMSRALAR